MLLHSQAPTLVTHRGSTCTVWVPHWSPHISSSHSGWWHSPGTVWPRSDRGSVGLEQAGVAPSQIQQCYHLSKVIRTSLLQIMTHYIPTILILRSPPLTWYVGLAGSGLLLLLLLLPLNAPVIALPTTWPTAEPTATPAAVVAIWAMRPGPWDWAGAGARAAGGGWAGAGAWDGAGLEGKKEKNV